MHRHTANNQLLTSTWNTP